MAQFETKGADNSIEESGSEADPSEFDAAAAALHGFLDARAAHVWDAACAYLPADFVASFRQVSEQTQPGAPRSCAATLAGLSAGIPDFALRDAAVADVGAFRVEGERGFLLFHGAHSVDYFMPMVREGGHWKVAAIAPTALG